MADEDGLLLHVPLGSGPEAVVSGGSSAGVIAPGSASPGFERDGARVAARFGRDTCVLYEVAGNFSRDAGTVMMWFRPDWPADFDDELGRILWDLRIEHGSAVADDPSQRWALVYPSPAGKGRGGRPDDTFGCWRLCLATNRNQYTIGTDQRRPDQRTRQAVFGTQQRFAAHTWMHLAVTWERDAGAIYTDGRLDARGELPEGLPDKPLPEHMQLGARSSWINAGACGLLADFRVYSRALDGDEIRARAGL